MECDATTLTTNLAAPTKNCKEFLVRRPQEMNTMNKGNIVKTIESQKEIFLCNIGAGIFKNVDIVLLTEIWENLNNLSNPIIKIAFEAVRCVLNIGVAEVETCRFLNVFSERSCNNLIKIEKDMIRSFQFGVMYDPYVAVVTEHV